MTPAPASQATLRPAFVGIRGEREQEDEEEGGEEDEDDEEEDE